MYRYGWSAYVIPEIIQFADMPENRQEDPLFTCLKNITKTLHEDIAIINDNDKL